MKRDTWVGFLPFYLLVVIGFLAITHLGSEAVTAISQSRPPEREHTIVIDAGHGGVDGGATSCTGVLESQINLEIALRLEDMLHLLGMDTVMIRRTDESVYTEGNTIGAKKVSDLKNRVRMVQETPNAILVSLHQNTFSDTRYRGAQVFYGGADESQSLAKQLQQLLVSSLNPGSRRQPKTSKGIYLMDHISCPAILVECGFLSNPEEEALLRNPSYQVKICAVIGSTLSRFAATP